MGNKRRWWRLDKSWRGYIRDTWLIWIIMVACYVAFCWNSYRWMDDEITFLETLVYAGLPFILLNIGLIGAAHYYRVNFGMTDEKIDAMLEDMKKKNRERPEQENRQKPKGED